MLNLILTQSISRLEKEKHIVSEKTFIPYQQRRRKDKLLQIIIFACYSKLTNQCSILFK